MPDFHKQAIPYPARYDYGARPARVYPTLAVIFHMAEGTNVAQYLAGNGVSRGVSVHYTIERKTARWRDGQVVLCLKENRISGSVNPDTLRRTNDAPTAIFGYKHAKDALGKWWSNPNVAVVTVEVAGRNKDGPTPAQVASMVALHADIQRRYGGRVVPLGHRDFQNVKPCPGKTPAIRRAYQLMGGHGADYDKSGGQKHVSTRAYKPNHICTVTDDAPLFDYPGGPRIGDIDPPLDRAYLGKSPNGREFVLVGPVTLGGQARTAWTKATKVANIRPAPVLPPPSVDRYDEGKDDGLDLAQATVTAIPRSEDTD